MGIIEFLVLTESIWVPIMTTLLYGFAIVLAAMTTARYGYKIFKEGKWISKRIATQSIIDKRMNVIIEFAQLIHELYKTLNKSTRSAIYYTFSDEEHDLESKIRERTYKIKQDNPIKCVEGVDLHILVRNQDMHLEYDNELIELKKKRQEIRDNIHLKMIYDADDCAIKLSDFLGNYLFLLGSSSEDAYKFLKDFRTKIFKITRELSVLVCECKEIGFYAPEKYGKKSKPAPYDELMEKVKVFDSYVEELQDFLREEVLMSVDVKANKGLKLK